MLCSFRLTRLHLQQYPSLTRQRRMNASFDTFNVVKKLESSGFTREQSEVILDVIRNATAESGQNQTVLLAAKNDLLNLKSELSEKVFNSTMKFDVAQRHTRELVEKDIASLKNEIKAIAKQEVNALQQEIVALEKRVLEHRSIEELRMSEIKTEILNVEKRTLQYGVTFMATVIGILIAAVRLVGPMSSNNNNGNNGQSSSSGRGNDDGHVYSLTSQEYLP